MGPQPESTRAAAGRRLFAGPSLSVFGIEANRRVARGRSRASVNGVSLGFRDRVPQADWTRARPCVR